MFWWSIEIGFVSFVEQVVFVAVKWSIESGIGRWQSGPSETRKECRLFLGSDEIHICREYKVGKDMEFCDSDGNKRKESRRGLFGTIESISGWKMDGFKCVL